MRQLTTTLLALTTIFCMAQQASALGNNFEASFEHNGQTYVGEVKIDKLERVQRCMNRMTGSITLSTQEILPVIGSEKVCGWVGPAPVANYIAVLTNGESATLKPANPCPPSAPIYCEDLKQCVGIWYCCGCH